MLYKNVDCCEHCKKENNIRILSFHHIDTSKKTNEVSEMITNLYIKNIEDIPKHIKDEIDNCKVLCHNCHMEEHFDKEFFEQNKDKIFGKSNNIKEIQSKINREDVLNLYRSGLTQIEIARKYKASKGTICDILKGLDAVPEKPKIEDEKILELFREGFTNTKIHDILKVSRKEIQKILKKNGLVKNKAKGIRKFDPPKEELEKLLSENCSLRDMGKIYNVSYVAIRARLIKFGLRGNKND